MTDAATIAKTYLETWNETDAERRRSILEKHWTSDCSYQDPLMQGEGQGEIASLAEGVQQRFPGFHFTLNGVPNGYGDFVRLSWTLGPEGVEAPVEGSDVVTVRHGKIARVIGFIDPAPTMS